MGDNFWINFSQFFQFYLYGCYIFKHLFKKWPWIAVFLQFYYF